MVVRFIAPDLQRLDTMKAEALCLPLTTDERPLRGILGLIDWRLCGRISRMIIDGRISGELDELLLMPARPKLSFDKLFLYGVGSAAVDPAAFDRAVERLLGAISRARIRSIALELPRGDTLAASTAMTRFLDLGRFAEDLDDLNLIEDAARQREMKPIVDNHRRKQRAVE